MQLPSMELEELLRVRKKQTNKQESTQVFFKKLDFPLLYMSSVIFTLPQYHSNS